MEIKWKKEHYYLLGFFYADGCVHTSTKKHKNDLSVTIHKNDANIINEFKNLFGGSTYSVGKNGEYLRWFSTNRKLYHEFLNLGLMPKKTLLLNRIPNIPDTYLKDFIRGYFDGDGSTWISSHNTIVTEIWGTKLFLESLKSVIEKFNDHIVKTNIENGRGQIFRIRYNQSQSFILYKWMYYENCLCLTRKKEKFEKSISRMQNLKRTRNLWTKQELEIIINNYNKLSLEQIANMLPKYRSKNSICNKAYILRKQGLIK